MDIQTINRRLAVELQRRHIDILILVQPLQEVAGRYVDNIWHIQPLPAEEKKTVIMVIVNGDDDNPDHWIVSCKAPDGTETSLSNMDIETVLRVEQAVMAELFRYTDMGLPAPGQSKLIL